MEQAAEKIIRAILTSEGKHGGIKHALDDFVAMLPEENPIKPQLQLLTPLAAYATSYRYPTPAGKIPASMTGRMGSLQPLTRR